MRADEHRRLGEVLAGETPEDAAELLGLTAKLAAHTRTRRAWHRNEAKKKGKKPDRAEAHLDWCREHLARTDEELDRGPQSLLKRALELVDAAGELTDDAGLEVHHEHHGRVHAGCLKAQEAVRVAMQDELDAKAALIDKLRAQVQALQLQLRGEQ